MSGWSSFNRLESIESQIKALLDEERLKASAHQHMPQRDPPPSRSAEKFDVDSPEALSAWNDRLTHQSTDAFTVPSTHSSAPTENSSFHGPLARRPDANSSPSAIPGPSDRSGDMKAPLVAPATTNVRTAAGGVAKPLQETAAIDPQIPARIHQQLQDASGPISRARPSIATQHQSLDSVDGTTSHSITSPHGSQMSITPTPEVTEGLIPRAKTDEQMDLILEAAARMDAVKQLIRKMDALSGDNRDFTRGLGWDTLVGKGTAAKIAEKVAAMAAAKVASKASAKENEVAARVLEEKEPADVGIWQLEQTADGTYYYTNHISGESSWVKPRNWGMIEQRVANQPWRIRTSEDGATCFYHVDYKTTQWEMPESLKWALGERAGEFLDE